MVAHERFLNSLLKEDFTLGTHQGPLLPFHRLSGYVWEDTKLVHMVPTGLLPTNLPQAWWPALKLAPPVAHGPTFDAQEPVKLRDYAYPAAAGLGNIAARSSDTDPLSPDSYTSQRAGALILFRDKISNRFAIRLRVFRAFRGATVLVQEQNFSFLWWETPPAGWDEWMAGQAVNLTGCPEDCSVKTA